MSRKPHTDPGAGTTPEQERPPLLASLGGSLVVAGGLVVAGVTMGGMETRPWVPWVGGGCIVLGLLFWLVSGMPHTKSLEWIKSGLFALTLALLIRWPMFEPYRIPSGSMEPTLHGDARMGKGDRVYVNKWVYGVRVPFMNARLWYGKDPERWDIVVFKSIEEDAKYPTLVKRIVGMPGERINIRGGKVYADGVPLALPADMPQDLYYTSPSDGRGGMRYGVLPADEHALVPAGHYLVLGDNSSSSRDGRYFGWVPNEHLVGRVASIWWPPSRWRDFTGFSRSGTWRGVLGLLMIGILLRLFVGRSWAVIDDDGKRINHLLVGFVTLGLRIPFTHRWLSQWGAPRRGQVTLYRPSDEDLPGDTVLIGRVAGLPGETLTIEAGRLCINGEPLDGPHWNGEHDFSLTNPKACYGKQKKFTEIPADHFFIVNESADDDVIDSRIVGWIPRRDLVGTALAIWWPVTRWQRVD